MSAHSTGHEEVPPVWPFNATEKLDPAVRELLSMHCSWCVLDCGEAQLEKLVQEIGQVKGTRLWNNCLTGEPNDVIGGRFASSAPQ